MRIDSNKEGYHARTRATPEEPKVVEIHNLAKYGLSETGRHGPLDAMGVPRDQLPHWDDIQMRAAQFAKRPQADDAGFDSNR